MGRRTWLLYRPMVRFLPETLSLCLSYCYQYEYTVFTYCNCNCKTGDNNTLLCCNTKQDNIKQGNNNVGVLNQPFSFIFPGAQTRKRFAERGTVHSRHSATKINKGVKSILMSLKWTPPPTKLFLCHKRSQPYEVGQSKVGRTCTVTSPNQVFR